MRVWSKVMALTVILFFALLADAILSDWVPVYLQNVLGGSFMMGIVMSFSSVVGFSADFIFPQLLKGTTVRKMMVMAVLSGALFSAILLWATWWPVIMVLLLAMAIWGVYYEFLGFANQQFVAETAPVHQRAQVWAVMGIFKNLAYFLGPILGGYLIGRGDRGVVMIAGGISIVAYVLLLLFKIKNKPVVVEMEEINLGCEASHWWTLLPHVWPVLVLAFALGLIDATFWTTGTVFTEVLAKQSWWGGLFLSMYMLLSLFVGLFVLKWGIYQGKKKWAEIFLMLGGVFLTLLFYSESVYYQLAMVFLSSIMLSVSYPLVDAVYSDIVMRMGRERKHMVGLGVSMISLAYIVGPILSGWIASQVGERMTFVAVGAATVTVAIVLLITTPRKLLLPQREIKNWS
jgi:MFS family permease